jgi:hypothetical protein
VIDDKPRRQLHVSSRPTLRTARDFRRPAYGHHASSFVPWARTDVNDPIAGENHWDFVLDDDDGVAGVYEIVQLHHQLLDV